MLGKNLKQFSSFAARPASPKRRGNVIFTPTFPRPARLKDPTPEELDAYLKSEIAIAEALNAEQEIANLQKVISTPDICDYIESKCIDTDSVSRKTWNYSTMRGIKMISHQKRIMRHILKLDPQTGTFPYRTVLYSAPKKSAKTASTAFAGCWFAEYIEAPNTVYVAANTQGQAIGRIFEAMAITLCRYGAEYKKSDKQIILKNGTVVQAITNDPESEAGGSYGLVLISELWGWDGERANTLWAETMPVPTRLNSIRWVESYVGYEDKSELMLTLWKMVFTDTTQSELQPGAEPVPELADIVTTDTKGNIIPCCYRVPKEGIFVYVDHEHRFDWQIGEVGAKYFREISAGLAQADIMRLVHNRWQLTQNPLVSPENITAAMSRGKNLTDDGQSIVEGFPKRVNQQKKMSFAIDASMGRNDTTAIAGVYSVKDETVAPVEVEGMTDDERDIAGRTLTNVRFRCGYFKAYEPQGKKGERIDFDLDALVGDEIVRLWKAGFIKRREPDGIEKKLIENDPFLIPIAVYYDNYQMMQTATNLRKNHKLMIKELKQSSERIIADTLLQKVFITGQIDTPENALLEKHLTGAKAESASKKGEVVSKIRIVKSGTATQSIDGAVALSMAVYAESKNPPERRTSFGSTLFGKVNI